MSNGFLPRRWFAALAVACFAFAVEAPAAVAQATATTMCKDGTTSASSGRGACSGHGGIDRSASKGAPASTSAKAKAQVACTDGTTSNAGRGACSHHGGVATATSSNATAAPAPTRVAPTSPTLPASVPQQSPARTRSEAKSQAPNTTARSGGGEDNNPSGAIAQCKDGMYSHAKHRRGACSRHGGVGKWMST